MAYKNTEKRRAYYHANKVRIAALLAEKYRNETAEQRTARNEAKAAYSRAYRKNSPQKAKANQNKYRAKFSAEQKRETNRRMWLKKGYGITPEEYEARYRSQVGACKICGGQNIAGRLLAVDHDHATGRIRGLLCFHCNLILGNAKDNILTLYKAADYLEAANRFKEAVA